MTLKKQHKPVRKMINRVTAKKIARKRDRFGRVIVKKCQKIDCFKKPARGQLYCTKAHSPLGYYGMRRYTPDPEN